MKSKLIPSIWVIIINCLFLGGCATSRSIIDIKLPAPINTSSANNKEVYINSVTDNRLFELKPTEPSTPSLAPDEDGGANINHRAIGRKRNSFGKGLGDILLPEGRTVDTTIASILRQALVDNGYKIVSSREKITDDTYIIDAQIDKLWSWMNPGFWAITLSSEISTNVSIRNKSSTDNKIISVKNSDTYQAASESNWQEIIEGTLKQYSNELHTKLKSIHP